MRNLTLRSMIMAAIFAAALAAVAQFKFYLPGVPNVPVTLQVLVVYVAGLLLGPTWGFVSMLVYVLLGAIGLPVYAGGASGVQVLLGPTGGYLMSYPVAALVIGLMAPPEQNPSRGRMELAMLLGLAIIYLGGAGWAILMGGKALATVISGWVLPFIPFDLLKMWVAGYICAGVNRALSAQGYWRGHAA